MSFSRVVPILNILILCKSVLYEDESQKQQISLDNNNEKNVNVIKRLKGHRDTGIYRFGLSHGSHSGTRLRRPHRTRLISV